MTQEQTTEIQAILALQAQVTELQSEVSRRLQPFKNHRHFVLNGEIWEMTRWGELNEPIRKDMFSAWCLKKIGDGA